MNGDYRPPFRWIKLGLTFSIVANVGMIVMWFSEPATSSVPPVANFVVIFICAAAFWLVRARQKGRL